MNDRKHFFGDILQGVAILAILYYLIFGDPSRLPVEWLGSVPRNPMTSSAAFLFWMLLLYFVQGCKAAGYAGELRSPIRRALDIYISYWIACVPLVIIGACFFNERYSSPLYCPMFVNLNFLNLSRAIVALSNNIHEGTWVVSSLAICAFCASLYFRVCEKKGPRVALLVPVSCVAVHCLLYLVALPFMYHKAVFPIAAVAGSAVYMLGFMLFQRPAVNQLPALQKLNAPRENRYVLAITAPLRYIGRNWATFWMVQFYLTFYYIKVAASVYMIAGTAFLSYLIFAISIGILVFALDWTVRQVTCAFRQSKWSLLAILPLMGLPFLLRLTLEVSMDNYAQFATVAKAQWPYYALVTVFAILCLIVLLRSLTGHWLASGVIITVLMTLLGIVNHYTMKYHGTLVTVEDLNNIQTAANVVGSYDMSIDEIAGKVLLYGGAGLACCIAMWLLARTARKAFEKKQRWISRAVCLLTAFSGLYMCYFAPVPLIARQDNVWSWGSLYAKIGFFSGTVESTLANLEFSVRKPEGYSHERIAQLKDEALARREEAAASSEQEYVDIIMILNETWYNLDTYINTNADVDYMYNYNALENAIKGFTEVPLTAGGTNGTEYEMLTANSMSLVNAYAPFNRLNFTETVSLPMYLKELGYATIAAHPHQSQNYHRGTSWTQMGFDRNYFIEDFTDMEFYANRVTDNRCTDTSALRNVIRFYDDMPEDQPRFVFFATMQSHGGWTLNTPDQALVRASIQTDKKGLAEKVDEFLSCMKLTDDMIPFMQQYFTEQYERTGRKVVICMCGDHSPSFISSMKDICKWDDPLVAERKGRSTPYFIWANYPLELDQVDLTGTEDMDLCCFMPTTLKIAGVPLSYYYGYICDLRRDVLVFTNVGMDAREAEEKEKAKQANQVSNSKTEEVDSAFYFCDRDGVPHDLNEDSELARRVRDYMYMEYNLNGDSGALETALFMP